MPDDSLLFRALLETSTDNIYVLDEEGRYTHVSRGAAEMMGVTPEAMIGRTGRELGVPSELADRAEGERRQVRESGKPFRSEAHFGGRMYDYSISPVHVDGKIGVLVVSRDTTERAAIANALVRSEERYRGFIENSSEGIWLFEVEVPIDITLPHDEQIGLMFQHAYLAEGNDAMARMYGFDTAAEMIGARLPDFMPPTVSENLEYLGEFIAAGYRLTDAESVEADRFGNTKYFLNSLIGVVEDGKLHRAWGLQRDVTDQRMFTERLRLSEERLQALVNASTQVVWTTDAAGALDRITPSWTAVTGQSIEEAKGNGWSEAIHPHDREHLFRAWKIALETKTIYDAVARVRTHDGAWRWFHLRAAPVINHGIVREWVGSSTDIDAERRQEQLVAAEQARAEFIAEANDLFVRTLDYEQTLRNLATMSVPALADWCAVDVVQPDRTFKRVAVRHLDPAKERLAMEVQQRWPSGPDEPYGPSAVARTGRTEWVAEVPDELLVAGAKSPEHLQILREIQLRSYICTPIRTRDRVAGVLTLITGESGRTFNEGDVSLAEELALRAGYAVENAGLYQQALEANRAKDEFLATLSHELRTPLTAILGWANLLRMSNFDPDTLRLAVETIERSARTQATLIDDLLDVSRIVTGKFRLTLGTVDVVTVIEAVVASMRPAAEGRRVTIDVAAPPSLPIRADANRLQQIVWNLVSNAVKFSSEGGRIEVTAKQVGEQVAIRVCDEGTGIHPELLPRVFDRFWQAESAANRAHGGLGLGLAIVKHLAEMHGGTASATSDGTGRGATFTVMLPVGAAATATAAPAPDTQPEGRARVLLVDDDEPARQVVEKTLQHFGASVIVAASAADAVALLDGQSFDLVLTDIAMPDRDGYWLLQEVRRRTPGTRVAAITALGIADQQIAEAGFDSWVRKPVEPAALAALLHA